MGAAVTAVSLEPRETEVQQLDVAVRPDHHVFRLDVAVDDLRGVRDGERFGDLPRDAERALERDALAPRIFRSVDPSTSSMAM